MLYGLILSVHILVCLILIAVILLQAGRGGGLADTFGAGTAQSIMGTRGTAYLTRATGLFATVFMLTSLGLAIVSAQRGLSLIDQAVPSPKAQASAVVPEPQEEAPPPGGTSLDRNVEEATPEKSAEPTVTSEQPTETAEPPDPAP